VAHILVLELCWEKNFVKDFIGQRWLRVQRSLCRSVTTAKDVQEIKKSSSLTQLIQPTWSLRRWGMDIIGPMLAAQGNIKYALVAVEYFSMWIEAKASTTITSTTIQKFFCQNIICHFKVSKSITVDNGTQFDSEAFRAFCGQVGTNIDFASVRHPDSNGLVERACNTRALRDKARCISFMRQRRQHI
jgi:IS30 family transposase